jgi:hypothetical protein
MTLKIDQQFSLFDGQGRDLGTVRVYYLQGDLVFGRFAPSSAYAQVESLFAEYVAAANEQLLGVVGELDEKIARLNLHLHTEESSALPAIHDVQIGDGTINFRVHTTLTSANGPTGTSAGKNEGMPRADARSS